MSDNKAAAGKGSDTDRNDQAKDENAKPGDATKTQDLTKAGRDGFDPDEGTE